MRSAEQQLRVDLEQLVSARLLLMMLPIREQLLRSGQARVAELVLEGTRNIEPALARILRDYDITERAG